MLSGLQIIGLFIFLRINTIQVDLVSNGWLTKNNLYSPFLAGYYRRQYYKPHKGNGCNDGKHWMTKVYLKFKIIEIEVENNNCYKRDEDWNTYTPE